MAFDREKAFANAERLFKQAKAREAIDECRRIADDAPRDLLVLNRVGDLLARCGRPVEAIGYYEKIAEQFSASGFYPKAIAILKKIVKVDPARTEVLVRLGELNLKQKLPGEARPWLLQAADAYTRAKQFPNARGVYERLVAAEPDELTHAVRLSQARAAEGDTERAGRELIALGVRMVSGGRAEEAEQLFRQALALLPGRPEPLLGLARVAAAAGRVDDALRLADEAWAQVAGADAAVDEVLVLFERLGADTRSAALLRDERSDALSDDAVEQAVRTARARDASDEIWTRLTPLLDRWLAAKRFDRAAQLLECIGRVDDSLQLRAFEAIVSLRRNEGNKHHAARAIERLVRAYSAQGLQERVDEHLSVLASLDPASPMLLVGRPPQDPRQPAPERAASPGAPAPGPLDAPPAVPASPADEEFVSGHLTEAEVFEKYGLVAEAFAQLREVTQRFPGHVAAQTRLVQFLRTRSDRDALRDALVALAIAKNADGDADGARRCADEASRIGGIAADRRAALTRAGLLAVEHAQTPDAHARAAAAPHADRPPAQPRKAAASPASPPPPVAAAPPAAEPPAPRAAAPAPAGPMSREEEDELEILFDDAGEAGASTADEADLDEIEFYLGQGMVADAATRIAALRAAGRKGPRLDRLEALSRGGAATAASDAERDAVETIVPDASDEQDLASLAEVLDSEFGGDRPSSDEGEERDAEASPQEALAAFKEHVSAQVEGGDFRTHYDLGIAYKQMGLVDDAFEEFRLASGSPELYRESCTMLGLMHWERGEAQQAIRYYREALRAPETSGESTAGLRYELAEILLATGDLRGAYELFVEVLNAEPSYRDVAVRVDEIRLRMRS